MSSLYVTIRNIWRKVVSVVPSPNDSPGYAKHRHLNLECGHTMIVSWRKNSPPPSRWRCEHCERDEYFAKAGRSGNRG